MLALLPRSMQRGHTSGQVLEGQVVLQVVLRLLLRLRLSLRRRSGLLHLVAMNHQPLRLRMNAQAHSSGRARRAKARLMLV